MQALVVIAQTSVALAKCAAMLIALALAMVSPAPKHATQQHHQPIRLPELAAANYGLVAQFNFWSRERA